VERRRGLPGKPAKIYRLTAGPVQISHPMRRYDVLAESLARAVGDGPDGEAAMRAAGRALGRSLARSLAASTTTALEPLVEMGAAYEVERDGRITCTNCLFAEVCRRVPTVCHFHAGAIESLTGRDGVRSRIQSLGFQGPSGCVFMEVD
jgi:predicted ArsR family transcriptional regulator